MSTLSAIRTKPGIASQCAMAPKRKTVTPTVRTSGQIEPWCLACASWEAAEEAGCAKSGPLGDRARIGAPHLNVWSLRPARGGNTDGTDDMDAREKEDPCRPCHPCSRLPFSPRNPRKRACTLAC